MENYPENKRIVDSTWNGNHINQPPDDRRDEDDMETAKCDLCEEAMTFSKHYVNGGLCFNCIMEV